MTNPYANPVMYAQQTPVSLPQWQQGLGSDPSQTQNAATAGQGLSDLLKRFKKPVSGAGMTDSPLPQFGGGGIPGAGGVA